MSRMLEHEYKMGRRAVRLAVLAGMTGLLSACAGVTPMTHYPTTGGQEMDLSQPGVLSGDDGSITLYERK
jgi:hypothetical protein